MNQEKHNHQGTNCSICLYHGNCDHTEPCEYLAPIDEDDYITELMASLRDANVPAPTRKLGGGAIDKRSLFDDGVDTTYQYYRRMINECLNDIRSGRTTYVYRKEHVAEILRFEPDIYVTFKDGIYYITL